LDKLRVGVIGVGGFGELHVSAYKDGQGIISAAEKAGVYFGLLIDTRSLNYLPPGCILPVALLYVSYTYARPSRIEARSSAIHAKLGVRE